MRVRVRFRFNSETGEVETFVVEDIGGARAGVDHDAVHDAITADVARVIEQNALIEQVRDARAPEQPRAVQPASTDETPREPQARSIDE